MPMKLTVMTLILLLMSGGALYASDQLVSSPSQLWYSLPPPDQSDWSNKRRSGYARLQDVEFGAPEAVLRFPTLDLNVAVFDNAERSALELGAGWVEGTAWPGEAGNVAIAGHRDGFFRPLEQIESGQEIVLVTEEKELRYQVDSIRIVDALDVSVLEPSDDSRLTLITCYPFRYVGFAPDRFIVTARLSGE